MRRLAMALAVTLCAPLLLGAGVSPGRTTAEVEALGWRKAQWSGIRPVTFTATPAGGIRATGNAQGAFLWRPVQGPATCLTWRWRVDEGPPPTDLARRGGDDRAIAVAVGFNGFGPQMSFATRAQHGIAQAAAGDHRLPRSVLFYIWGGTGREAPPGTFFASPWTAGLSKLRVMRPADAPRGQWMEERVDLGADWRAAFGGNEAPGLQEIMITVDVEDTNSRVDAQVENIRLVPCR
jgi:hypothetical protein